jgi:competence protein ComEC
MAGETLAAHFAHLSPPALVFIAITGAGLLFFLRKKTKIILILIFFSLVGFIHTDKALQPPKSPSHIYNLISKRSLVTLDGTITSIISQSEGKSHFILIVHKIIRRDHPGTGKPIPATGKIRLSVNGRTAPAIQPGQRVLAIATVDKINNYQTPGTFNYVLYMHNRGIYNSGWISSLQQIQPAGKQDSSTLADFFLGPEKIRQKISLFLENTCTPDVRGLYQALLIGERSGLSPQIREQFIRTGTMHLLSISGLHMGLLALMVYGLLSWIMKRSQWLLLHTHVPTLALAFSFPILFLYTFIAGMNTPIFRSLIMAAVLLFALLIRRQASILHLVAAAALIILTINPLSLFTASFQLSFAAMVAIAVVYPRLSPFFFSKDSNLTSKRNTISALLRWPFTAFLLSIAATVGTLPFLLYHFNRFSPVGPVMNLLIEPLLCFIALPLGLLAAPVITFAPDWAEFFFHLGGIALQWADSITKWASQFPYVSLWTITPSIFEILFYFTLLFLACAWTHKWKNKVLLFSSTLLLINFVTEIPLPVQQQKHAEISFLDVGQGTATLFEFTNGSNILLDGGGSYSERYNVGKNIIAPFLWKKRIRHIETIIITHPDSDHYSGLHFIVQQFHPETVYTNGQYVQAGSYHTLMRLIAKNNIPTKQAMAGERLYEDSLCRLSCLGMPGLPITTENTSDNNQSVVLRLQCGENKFLFPGDIESKAENLLLQKNIVLRSDVLLASHHGSKTSNSHAFLRAVSPQLIIVSAGRTKTNLFPALKHTAWWKEQNLPFLITGIDGTITCITDGTIITTTH